jgi:hypothetical protein
LGYGAGIRDKGHFWCRITEMISIASARADREQHQQQRREPFNLEITI